MVHFRELLQKVWKKIISQKKLFDDRASSKFSAKAFNAFLPLSSGGGEMGSSVFLLKQSTLGSMSSFSYPCLLPQSGWTRQVETVVGEGGGGDD
jgi:hypothetical protein